MKHFWCPFKKQSLPQPLLLCANVCKAWKKGSPVDFRSTNLQSIQMEKKPLIFYDRFCYLLTMIWAIFDTLNLRTPLPSTCCGEVTRSLPSWDVFVHVKSFEQWRALSLQRWWPAFLSERSPSHANDINSALSKGQLYDFFDKVNKQIIAVSE